MAGMVVPQNSDGRPPSVWRQAVGPATGGLGLAGLAFGGGWFFLALGLGGIGWSVWQGLRLHRRADDLAQSTARFRAALDAVPDGMALFDAEDRLVFHNRAYPDHLAPAARETLAEGMRFEDWLHAAAARGPLFHADMGADFLDRRLDMRQDHQSDHMHRIRDGRWIRNREIRTPDGGKVLLTGDVTEEVHRDAKVRMLAAAIEQVGDPVEITQADHGFAYLNQAFERATGWPRAEVLGKLPQDVLSSGVHPVAFFEDIRDRLESGESWHGTIINRHRDGHLIEQDTTISPLRDETGRITHYVAVKRDVTAARAQARALEESEARYRAVVDTQTEFILRVDPEGNWTFMNEAATRFMGRTLEDLRAGHKDGDFIHPEDADLYRSHIASITPQNPTHTVELRSIHHSKPHWESWTDTGIFDEAGRLVEIQCVGRDITGLKLAEMAREEAERLRRAALEAALDCFIAVDDAGRVIEFNAAAERTFGYARSEILGRDMAEAIIPSAEREAHRQGMRRHQETGLATLLGRRIEVEALRSDGTTFPIELVIVKGERGGRQIYLAYLRDLTERREAERRLADSEARFRSIAENVPVGVMISDIETSRPLFINATARAQLGLAQGEMPEAMRGAWAEPGTRERLLAALAETGAVQGFEAELILPGDRHMTALFSATRIHFDGTPALLTATVDITAQRATEVALRDSQARLQAFMEYAPVAAHLRDLDGRYLMVNREMERIMEAEASHAAAVGSIDALHGQVIATGAPCVSELQLPFMEGSYEWILSIRFPVRDAEGRVTAVGTFNVDITERKAAEAALRASEARLEAIIEANPAAQNIARLSDRRLLFVNQPYVELFGLQGIDLDTFDRNQLYADPAERNWIFEEISSGRSVTGFELMLKRADGTPVPASLTSRPILFQGESAVVTSTIDLTALRAAEAEVARSREALHQSEKMTALGSLLAGVAHELNNPLSVVVGYASMLKELVEDEEMRGRVDKIHEAAERCARIVRTFLSMARARPPRRGPVDMGVVVEGALDLAAYGLRGADVALQVEVPSDLPPVWGDADQLHQVMVNLMVNAQHALTGHAAPRRLSLRGWTEGADVVVEVADTGPGMDAEVAKRAFEPFFTTKPQGVGTGVGLSVCHGIVKAHGGHILLETAPGEGARFKVVLPRAGEAVPEAAAAMLPHGRGGRILVVDDEADIALLIAERLRREGHMVETAASGRHALEALAAAPFDVVISDLRMPDIDGAALVEAIASRHPALAGRILLVTGDTLGADMGAGALAGLPVFEKPIDLEALLAELGRHLGEDARR